MASTGVVVVTRRRRAWRRRGLSGWRSVAATTTAITSPPLMVPCCRRRHVTVVARLAFELPIAGSGAEGGAARRRPGSAPLLLLLLLLLLPAAEGSVHRGGALAGGLLARARAHRTDVPSTLRFRGHVALAGSCTANAAAITHVPHCCQPRHVALTIRERAVSAASAACELWASVDRGVERDDQFVEIHPTVFVLRAITDTPT